MEVVETSAPPAMPPAATVAEVGTRPAVADVAAFVGTDYDILPEGQAVKID